MDPVKGTATQRQGDVQTYNNARNFRSSGKIAIHRGINPIP